MGRWICPIGWGALVNIGWCGGRAHIGSKFLLPTWARLLRATKISRHMPLHAHAIAVYCHSEDSILDRNPPESLHKLASASLGGGLGNACSPSA